MINKIVSATVVAALCCHTAFAYDEDFSSSDGGWVSTETGGHADPWAYDGGAGAWSTDGSQTSAPTHTRLTSPTLVVTTAGEIQVSFDHFYSIEGPDWDAGALFASVNGGAFTYVDGSAFTANGYNSPVLVGQHDLQGSFGFTGDSAGYPTPITSTASLGVLGLGDTVAVQFLMANDQFAIGANLPNWQIDSVSVPGTQAVPEPGSLLLIAACSGLLAFRLRG